MADTVASRSPAIQLVLPLLAEGATADDVAARLIEMGLSPAPGTVSALIDDATTAFDGYDYARALERTEAFFWWFCDDYVELVKGRAYGDPADPGTGSAVASLRLALSVLHRLFALETPGDDEPDDG